MQPNSKPKCPSWPLPSPHLCWFNFCGTNKNSITIPNVKTCQKNKLSEASFILILSILRELMMRAHVPWLMMFEYFQYFILVNNATMNSLMHICLLTAEKLLAAGYCLNYEHICSVSRHLPIPSVQYASLCFH